MTIEKTQRRYDFDWLRVIGVLLVFLAHSTAAFIPWAPQVGGIEKSLWFGELVWIGGAWLMPLFFLLSGGSVWFALRKRTNKQYIRERLARILLPLFIGMFTLVVPPIYLLKVTMGEYHGSLWSFYLHFFDGRYPEGNFSFLHLWFLAYLFVYALAALPVFRWLERPQGRRLTARLLRFAAIPGGLYILALPLILSQIALLGPFPGETFPIFIGDWANHARLFLCFTYGYLLMSDSGFRAAIDRHLPVSAFIVIVTSAILFAAAWHPDFDPIGSLPPAYSTAYIAFSIVSGLCTWSWIVLVLGLGQRFLNHPHPALGRAHETVLPFFMLHMPVIAAVMYSISDWSLGLLPTFLVIISVSLPLTIFLCEIARRLQITSLLLGLKVKTVRSVQP